MGLTFPADSPPDKYFCEQCRPEDHKELLDAIAKGERPWEEVARRREEARKAKKKKGGKKGRKSGGRPSEVQSEVSQEVDTTQPNEVASPAPPASGQKRKLDDTPTRNVDNKKARSASASVKASSPPVSKNGAGRKSSMASAIPQTPPVTNADQLTNTGRKSAAKALIKLFTDQAKAAQKAGSYNPPQGQTAVSIGNTIGLAVEHAMFASLSGPDELSEHYKTQLRTILHNVKSNTTLRDRVLGEDLLPHALAVMSAEDMASEEQQQRDAAIKKEAEKQHMIIHEQGPRIRRTHKGDEFVDEARQVATEPMYPVAPSRRRESHDQETSEPRSPSQINSDEAEKQSVSQVSRKPPAIDTQAHRPSTSTDRRSSSNFNIQEVWSSVGSPDQDRPHFPAVAHRPVPQEPGPGAQPDAEIDELLKDEDNESEPYSPKDDPQDSDIVWNGRIDMEPIAGFRGTARFTAGSSTIGMQLGWENLIPRDISINGRIDTKRADIYLCGLRYSTTTDVVVLSVRPPDHPAERESFDKLFSYFKERDRYGVGAKHALSAVKDTYVMPIESGATNDQKPEFLQLLDNDNIPSPNPERLLLVVFVVRFSELSQTPASAAARDAINTNASPIATAPSATPIQQTTPYSNLNGQPTSQQFSPTPPTGVPHNADGAYSPATYQGQQPIGSAAVAQQVLPPNMVGSPAIQELILQAPNLGIEEMNVVKDCLERNPAAAVDIQVLTTMILEKQAEGQPG